MTRRPESGLACRRIGLFLALGAPLMALPLQPQDPRTIPFAPEVGTVLQKTFVVEHNLKVTSFQHQMNEAPVAELDLQIALDSELRQVVVDEYRRVGDNRALEFRRTYAAGSLTGHQNFLGVEDAVALETELDAALTDSSVVFTWVPEEQSYGRYYDGGEKPETWLKDLTADVDLRALLPTTAVAPGDSWTVDARELRDVLAPAGDLRFQSKKDTADTKMLQRSLRVGIGGSLWPAVSGEATGQVIVTLVSLEKDGRPVAEMSVTLDDVRFVQDISEFSEDNLLRVEEEFGYQRTQGRLALQLIGKGRLLWDLEERRARSFELTAEELIETAITVESPNYTTHELMQLAGVMTLSLDFQPGVAKPAPGPSTQSVPDPPKQPR